MSDGRHFPAPTIAKLLNISARRLRQLAEEGIVPRPQRGLYPLVGCVQGYIEFLQRSNRFDPQSASPDKLPPFARRAHYQAELAKRDVEQLRAELVAFQDARCAFEQAMAIAQQALEPVAARAAAPLATVTDPAQARSLLQAEVRRGLADAAARLSEWAEKIASGGK